MPNLILDTLDIRLLHALLEICVSFRLIRLGATVFVAVFELAELIDLLHQYSPGVAGVAPKVEADFGQLIVEQLVGFQHLQVALLFNYSHSPLFHQSDPAFYHQIVHFLAKVLQEDFSLVFLHRHVQS